MKGDGRPPLNANQLDDRIQEARSWLEEVDENDVAYESKKMVGESRLSNLQELWNDPVNWEANNREREEDLRMAQEMNQFLPVPENHQRPHSSHETTRLPTGFVPYAGSSINSFGGHFASDGAMAGHGLPNQTLDWKFQSENTTGPGTPTFSNNTELRSSGSASSVESAVPHPRKRQRSILSISTEPSVRVSKAGRPTPSPSMSSLHTPSSLESSVSAKGVPDGFFGLFGGDPNEAAREFRESRNEQEAQLKLMEAKRQQERADEEYARLLQEDINGQTEISFGTTQAAGPNVSNSNQTYIDANGRVQRATPLSSSPIPTLNDPFSSTPTRSKPQVASSGPSGFYNVKQENPYHASSSKIPVKNEPSHQSRVFGGPSNKFDDFITLDSDEEGEIRNPPALPVAHPSSDLVEIDSSSWLQSNHRAVPGVFPPGPSANAGYHGINQGGVDWNSISNTAQGYANNVYNAISQTMSSLGDTTGAGRNSMYGSNYPDPHIPIIDLDQEDYAPQSFYQRNMARAGIDPTNEGLVDIYRQRYDYIARDPTRTAREMKELLQNIRPDEDLPAENREGTPAAMVYPLMEHQKLGVAWMKRMEEGSNCGGILADDMGLGKTIQALALMVSRRSTNPARKTTLIVAPVALLKQWEREIEKKLKPGRQHSLSSFIYHGTKRAPWEKLRTFDVVLTTFGVVATEYKRRVAIQVAKRQNPNWTPSGTRDVLSLLGDECQWYRVIIDEAQCIKNKSTKAALGCCMLQAETRFCMTGTPMMNNVGELFSLIHFLRIRPYCDKEKFRYDIETPLKGQIDSLRKKAMRQLQALLKSLLLRRTKKSQIDGKPILDLPPRTTTVQHSVFSEDEHAFYNALETKSRLSFNKYLKAGTVGRNYSNILVLLLRLRQACCHPHLLKDFAQSSGPSNIDAQDMVALAKELAPDVVNRIKEQVSSNDSAQLECPICMDMAENPTIFIPCGHDTCSECFARITDPSQAIQDGETAEGHRDVKCPNCRGKITPSRVVDLQAFKKVHMRELCKENELVDDINEDSDSEDDSDSNDSDDSLDDDIDTKGNLRGFIVDDDDEPEENEELADGQSKKTVSKALVRIKRKSKGKGKAKDKGPKKTLAQLKKEAGIGSKARERYLRKLAKEWNTSAKIEKVMEILQDLRSQKVEETRQAEKTIVFSQFTSLLDLLEFPINREGWKYRRYDGSMTPKARNDAVLDFTDNPEIKVMLVSLKAGNSGLNLVAASQVIIFDPFWNPYIEEQAIDRAHRIGQLNPVKVHRILVPNTVEDRIIALQDKKRELIESALDEEASRSVGRLGTRELAFLFNAES